MGWFIAGGEVDARDAWVPTVQVLAPAEYWQCSPQHLWMWEVSMTPSILE